MSDQVDAGHLDAPAPPAWLMPVIGKTIWRVISAIALVLVVGWVLGRTRHVVNLALISIFLSLALAPGVGHLQQKHGWKRGTAVLVMYLAGVLLLVGLVMVLVPALVAVGGFLNEHLPTWIASLNEFLGRDVVDGDWANETAGAIGGGVAEWAADAFGWLAGFAASGIGFFFDLSSIALFTFYLTADQPKIRRALLTRIPPRRQQQLGWAWDRAITETGSYFYSRLLIMIVNGSLFFVALLLVGIPIDVALALAVFEAFIATFIPAVGTYIGAAVPIAIVLAAQGWQAGLVLLAWTLVYQSLENFALQPRISAHTMRINGGLAYAAVLVGGAVAGPFGAFVSLPVAALVQSFVSNYTRSYEVVYQSEFDADGETVPAGEVDDDRSQDNPT